MNEQKNLQTKDFNSEEVISKRTFNYSDVQNVRIKLKDGAKVPFMATNGSAGFDLYAHSVKEKDGKVIYGTGVSMQIPKGYVGLLFPRSSVYKKDLRMSNSVGVIDSDYRGEISAIFDMKDVFPTDVYTIGERCCQIVFVPYMQANFVEVDELDETIRNTGGMGSTGTK